MKRRIARGQQEKQVLGKVVFRGKKSWAQQPWPCAKISNSGTFLNPHGRTTQSRRRRGMANSERHSPVFQGLPLLLLPGATRNSLGTSIYPPPKKNLSSNNGDGKKHERGCSGGGGGPKPAWDAGQQRRQPTADTTHRYLRVSPFSSPGATRNTPGT